MCWTPWKLFTSSCCVPIVWSYMFEYVNVEQFVLIAMSETTYDFHLTTLRKAVTVWLIKQCKTLDNKIQDPSSLNIFENVQKML